MPLPFLAAIPALIAAASTTTLVVGGAVAAVAVAATIGAFYSAVRDIIRNYGARKAIVQAVRTCKDNGNYNTAHVGLYDDYDNHIGDSSIQVEKDVARDIRPNEVIYS